MWVRAVRRAVLGMAAVMGVSACGGGLRPLPSGSVMAPVPIDTPVGGAPSAPVVGGRPSSATPLSDGLTERDLDLLWARQLMVPVEGMPPDAVRDDFNARRRGSRAHRAVDLMAPTGTPVLAADDGVVGRVDRTRLGGNIIYATDPDGHFVYYYAHLDRHARGLGVGDTIRQGELLGYVGTTGNAPASVPHLHFQIMRRGAGRAWWDGPPINPWGFFVRPGTANQ